MRAYEFMKPRSTSIGARTGPIQAKREDTAATRSQPQPTIRTIGRQSSHGSAGQERDAQDRPGRG